jgi:hypothetical protein
VHITIDIYEIQRTIKKYFENLHSNKLKNLEEMNKFLNRYDLQKLNQNDMNNMNSSIMKIRLKQ